MGTWTKAEKPDKVKLVEYLQETYPDAHNVSFDSGNAAVLVEITTVDDAQMPQLIVDLSAKFPDAFLTDQQIVDRATAPLNAQITALNEQLKELTAK